MQRTLQRTRITAAALRVVIALSLVATSAFSVAAQTSTLGPPPPPISQADYMARGLVAARIDSGIIVAPGGREPVGHYPSFRQVPSFRYLTGFLEPDAALVLVKRGGQVTGTLFIEPPAPRTEFYTGTRVRYDELTKMLGLGARSNEELNTVLDSLAETHFPFYFVSDAESQEFIRSDSFSLGEPLRDAWRPRMRVSKSTMPRRRPDASSQEERRGNRAHQTRRTISDLGHRAAMQAARPNMNEYEMQAIMEYTFRSNGADRPSYASIVGSGVNSTTLHYDKDNRVMQTAMSWSWMSRPNTRAMTPM